MNAVVILPGTTGAIPSAPIVIGVNAGGSNPACTHAVALDLPAFNAIKPASGVKKIFSANGIQQSQQRTDQIPAHDGVIEDLFTQYPRKAPWSAHTLTAALVLAASLGATSVEVIGLDENNDIEGKPLPADFDDKRHDLIILDQTVRYLHDRGVYVDLGNESDSIPLPAEDGETPAPAA